MSRRFPIKRWSARGFTLIELLVVIGIIALLMAMIMPSFRGLGRSASMSGAVGQLRTTLSLARQWAINKRTNVHVVFVYSNSVTALPSEAWRVNRSYAVFVSTNGPQGYYLKEWTALPVGVVLASDASSFPGSSGKGDNVMLNGLIRSNVFPKSDSTTVAMLRSIQFSSDGTISGGSQNAIYITEGTVETNGVITIRTNGMKFAVDARQLTGQIRVRDYNQ